MIYTIELPGFVPTPLNKLLSAHWGKAGRLKAHDREIIATAVAAYGVPLAKCRRRVDMLVVWPKGRRSVDPDSLFKSTLDGLTHAGALANDSAAWCQLGTVRYAKGEIAATYLTLTDV